MSLFPAALTPSSPRRLASRLDYLLRGRLWAQILLAMVLGVALGLCLSPSGGALVASDTASLLAAWLALPGRLFLAMIQMVVVPLVLSSIILGITSSGDPKFLKQIGLRIAPYFILTTSVAVFIGCIVALWLQPGQYIDVGAELATATVPESAVAVASLPDRLIEIIPANPTSALLSRSMFQIVVLAIFIAVAMVSISERRAKPLLDLCVSVQDVSMKIVSWAMALAPIAVFGLLAQISVQVGFDAIIGVATYVATVLLGLVILLGFYLLIVTVLARRSPLAFLRSISNVQLLAFSTSSSAAVMPLSMKTAEESLRVKPAVSQFVVPLGATVNMDGTALYQVIAAVFLTQVYGIELSIAQLLLLSVTTVGASIGSPSTPGVGIVILATIVQGMGVPAEGLALILGVDRILDMSRTAVNVSGDLTACVVMERFLDDKVSD
ncbi:MAG: dicarboxylate/amino acid:cation symporter [Spongiibacter marinus]|uniref:dicarboxylate/amino acid:cation symporter n=1 Tax=Spongiibacter TaxID=630749 RepID=UPI000C0A0E51|nr:dicarboxylate/amino acid:cation symporter [Spongiibacter sp.]MAK44669.1 C4-dicarboxylate transporter [Spongiibacter sp.]|tara:strand:+ start:98 stop:1414 length:1317 start_codon:yes stop_codon:yes gene_type:complete